jgi:hypothetical protein
VIEQIISGDHSGLDHEYNHSESISSLGVKWDNYLDDNTQLQGAITSSSVFGALLSSILVLSFLLSLRSLMNLPALYHSSVGVSNC